MLNGLRKIVHEKNKIDQNQSWYNGSATYFDGLKDEIEEVTIEMKDDNSVHLEDELGDILWDYMLLLEGLKREGRITSIEKVFARAEKKYRERIDAIKNQETDEEKSKAWKDIKLIQKAELAKEHKDKYS